MVVYLTVDVALVRGLDRPRWQQMAQLLQSESPSPPHPETERDEERPKKKKKKKKATTCLTPQQSLSKYRARLLREFPDPDVWRRTFDGRFLSLRCRALEKLTEVPDGWFPFLWTRVLRDMALEFGATIRGVLPHYGTPLDVSQPELLSFDCRPDLVEIHLLPRYREVMLSGTPVVPGRVYVGGAIRVWGKKGSRFAFMKRDRMADHEWYRLIGPIGRTDDDGDDGIDDDDDDEVQVPDELTDSD